MAAKYPSSGSSDDDDVYDKPYPMDKTKSLGHAVIVNNIATEMPGSRKDADELKNAFEAVGYKVRVEENLKAREMMKLKRWMLQDKTHKDSNSFMMAVLCHGNKFGHLMDVNHDKAWDTEELVWDLSIVEALTGKPKVLLLQCCRGGSYVATKPEQSEPSVSGKLGPDYEPPPAIVGGKDDFFVGYATVPGAIALAGDEEGSVFFQSFAKYLKKGYTKTSLESIYRRVKQKMKMTPQGKLGIIQCPEERSSLTRVLHFGEYHGTVISKKEEMEKLMRKMEEEQRQKKEDIERQMQEEQKRKEKEMEEIFKKREQEIEERMRERLEKENRDKIEREKREKLLREKREKLEREEKKKTDKEEMKQLEVKQVPRHVKLSLLPTTDPRLYLIHDFTVMKQSGRVVVSGRRTWDGPWSLFIYTREGNELVEKQEIKPPCEHGVELLCINVQRAARLAVGCYECKDIKLLDLDTVKKKKHVFGKSSELQVRDVKTVFSGEHVRCMCEGDTDRLFVSLLKWPNDQILELDTSTLPFSPSRRLDVGVLCDCMCYIPVMQCIVGSNGGMLRAVSCSDSQALWEVEGEVDGREIDPCGLLYLKTHHVILVADGYKKRVLVVDPSNGSHLQTIDLPKIDLIEDLCLHDSYVVMKHKSYHSTHKLSYFSIN